MPENEPMNPLEMAEVSKLFAEEPLSIADSEEKLEKVVAYLRQTRANVAAAQQAGKRITKNAAQGKNPVESKPDNPINLLGE